MTYWQKWKYKNITLFLISLVVALLLSRDEVFHNFLLGMGDYGYIGAFVAGILYVSTFTVATGAIILLVLAEKLSPLELALIAGIGGVAGDFLIFRFIRDNIAAEVENIYEHLDTKHHIKRVFHTKYFSWTLPVMGALIIASPFPDELGVSLLGISKMKTYQFLFISFILNTIGILLIISASVVIKP